ncbi:spermidine synthase [Lachnoclostridium sp. Marseille-P6806]|uniref:spermidine synthase n=1 Tax=Lachnoclostridium sp. Marseille-P6806 TaxID=2364793 RepID=UPI00102FD5CE|nr:fused MFS/spermidine synthase [Lachnoclostridium sp. Marseille-P6806]
MTEPGGNRLLRSRSYLYITEFFAGMGVMAVELGASRLMAPYFSSSQIVWTIIISTIMIAMALGNLYGGRAADRDGNPDRLYLRILIAAVWIAAIPVLGKYVILAVSAALIFTVSENLLIVAAFAACMLIFVFPCFLLGTVTPSLVRFAVNRLDNSGSTVGRLNAFNTVGSILGTFLPTFVTIPAVGTAVSFLIFSGILLALALIYFAAGRTRRKSCAAAVLLFLFCTAAGNDGSFAFWEKGLAYEGESIYNYLQVKEDEHTTVLSTNVLFGVQSILRKDAALTGMYYDYAMAAPIMAGLRQAEAPRTVTGKETDRLTLLVLGMGTGTYARQCSRYFEDMEITGVEIDRKITELARTYFDLEEAIPVVTYDGRAYLQADRGRYDVIMVDAYQDITIPFQMSSLEFFRIVEEHLNPGGVMIVNMNLRSGSEGSINQYLADTIAAVFPYVYTADVPGNTNRELFASREVFDRDAFEAYLAARGPGALREVMTAAAAGLVPYEKGDYLLTDDRAPVELLGMRAIDEIIREEVEIYRKRFEEQGFSGVLDAL